MTNEYKLTDQELIERCEEIRTSHISIYRWPVIQELLTRFKQLTAAKLPATTNELLPCPFCGSDKIEITENALGFAIDHYILHTCSVHVFGTNREELIKIWNTRIAANPLTVESVVEALRKAAYITHSKGAMMIGEKELTEALQKLFNK